MTHCLTEHNKTNNGRIWEYISVHKDVILCALVCYILAHGEVLFQKVGYHDDMAHFFDIGTTYPSGRWALGFLKSLYEVFFGDSLWSMPVFNGSLVFVLLAACICLLTDYFNIQRKGLRLIFSSLFVIHPTVISLLGYLFTAPAYALSVLMAVGSGILLSIGLKLIPSSIKCNNYVLIVVAIMMGAFSLGIYQSYISFTLMILLFSLMRSTQNSTPLQIFYKILAVLATVLLIFISYLVIWKICLKITGIKPTDYKGINQFGLASIGEYILRIPKSYQKFFVLSGILYPFHSQYIFTAIICIAAVSFPIIVCLSPSIKNKVILIALYIIIPPAVNFSFLLVGTDLGSLSLYGQVMIFAAIISVIDATHINEIFNKRPIRILGCITLTLVVCTGIFQIRYANQAAVKGEYIQREYSSYFTTLVTRIQSTEGYTAKTPVLFVDIRKASGISIPKSMQDLDISPYGKENLVKYSSNYTANERLKKYLQQWCGFTAQYINDTSMIPDDVINSMPRYPDAGSIVIVNGILIVKF